MIKNSLFPNGHLKSFVSTAVIMNIIIFVMMIISAKDSLNENAFLGVDYKTLRNFGILNLEDVKGKN